MPPASETLPNSRSVELGCLRIAAVLGLVVSAVGLCVLAGWTFHLLILTTVLPGLVTMKANTAISLLLGGAGLFLLALPRPNPHTSRFSSALAVVMACLGALSLAEYLTGKSFGLDELLFHDPFASLAPGRMAPLTAINSVCIGIALVLLRRPRRVVIAQALAIAVAFTSVLAVVGYAYGVDSLYRSGNFTAVALHTSLSFLCLCVGVWCVGSRHGFMRLVANSETSGLLVRRCLPAAVILPLLIGWLRVHGVVWGWYSPEVGIVLVAMANASTFVVLLWVGASSVQTSERRREAARQALRRSEEQLNLVVENLTEGLVVWDLEGTLLHWNKAALSMHGFTTKEEGMRLLPEFTRIFEMFALDGKILSAEEWPLARLLAGQSLHDREIRVRRRDQGWERVYSYGGATVQGVGGRQLAFLTISDVTLRKEAQDRFQEIADAMPQIVWTARADGFIDYYNERWYEFTGQDRNHLSNESWAPVIHPEDRQTILDGWTAAVSSAGQYEQEFRVRRGADGEYLWFLGRGIPIKDAEGKVRRWIGTSTDIHAIKLLREQNEQLLGSERAARMEAERTGRMKDEFLATLSHELRTPLNAILGWTQVLRGDPAIGTDVEEGLATIERNARAQNVIIEDLLDMSRIISGKVRLDVQRIDLAPVVAAAVESLRPAAEARGIRLQPTLDPAARPVSGDPGRLQQVFWNLLSNAIKFTPKGGRVQVLLERVNSHLEVSVIDSGDGIDPGFLPYVFDRFRQADGSTTRQHGGLGLGLAIVKQLVELHGGSVQAKSPGPGQGTSFVVSLPLTALHPETTPEDTERRHPRGDSATVSLPSARLRLDGIKVMVVDDEPDARGLVRRLLEDRGAGVRMAGSAREAVDMVRAERPDVLVSDIGMPGEDGYELIRRLRALPPGQGGDVPAVALTAYARSEDRLKAMIAGFQAHLVKPVEAAELLVLVSSLAGRSPAVRESHPANRLEAPTS